MGGKKKRGQREHRCEVERLIKDTGGTCDAGILFIVGGHFLRHHMKIYKLRNQLKQLSKN